MSQRPEPEFRTPGDVMKVTIEGIGEPSSTVAGTG
jgi:hypothetical protein